MDVDEPEILDAGPPGAERIPSFGTPTASATSSRAWMKPVGLVVAAIVAFAVVANIGEDTEPPVEPEPTEETDAESVEPLTAAEVAAGVSRGASGFDEWYRLRLPDGLRVESATTGHDDDLLLLVTDGERPANRTLLRTTDGERWTGRPVSSPSATTSENVVMSLDSGGVLLAESDGAGFASLDGGDSWTVYETFQRSQVRSLERFDGARVGDVALVARLDDAATMIRLEGTEVVEVEAPGPVLALASNPSGFVALIRIGDLTTGVIASADGIDWFALDTHDSPVGVLLADDGTVSRPNGTLGLLLTIERVEGATIREIPNTFAGTVLSAPAAAGDRVLVLGAGVELTPEQMDALQRPVTIPDHDGREATLAVGAGSDQSFLFDGTAIGAGTRSIAGSGEPEDGVRFSDTEEDSFLEVLDLETGDLIARFSATDFEVAFEEAFGDLDQVFGARPSRVLQISDDAGTTWQSIETDDLDALAGATPTLLTTSEVSAIVGSGDVLFRPTTD